MAPDVHRCANCACGEAIQYYEAHCSKCGTFHSFPNVRAAMAERAELDQRYSSAVSAMSSKGTSSLLPLIEILVSKARAVVAMDVTAADNVTRSGKYRNYYQRIRGPERPPAAPDHHAERLMVDARFFPNFQENIQFLTLSLNGASPTSYGQVSMRLKDGVFLERRASLLERNSFLFFDEHNLGKLGSSIPLGYRSQWSERVKLIVAKIAGRAISTSTPADLERFFFEDLGNRKRDEFFEVHLFAERGIDCSEFDQVMLQVKLTDPEDQARWDLVMSSCMTRSVAVLT